jgi:SNF family Na+-dependent transporter
MMLIIVIRGITLPGAGEGLNVLLILNPAVYFRA